MDRDENKIQLLNRDTRREKTASPPRFTAGTLRGVSFLVAVHSGRGAHGAAGVHEVARIGGLLALAEGVETV